MHLIPAAPALPHTAFASLPLSPETLENLQQLGYLEMTPIQAAALPPALAGDREEKEELEDKAA